MSTLLIVVQMVRQRRYYGYNRYSGRGLSGVLGGPDHSPGAVVPRTIRQN